MIKPKGTSLCQYAAECWFQWVASNCIWLALIVLKFIASLMYLNVVWSIVCWKLLSTEQWDFVAQDDFFSTHERRSRKMKFKSGPLHLHFSVRFISSVVSCSLQKDSNLIIYRMHHGIFFLCAFQDMQNMHDTVKNSCFRCKYSKFEKTLIIYDICMPKKKKKTWKRGIKNDNQVAKKCMWCKLRSIKS